MKKHIALIAALFVGASALVHAGDEPIKTTFEASELPDRPNVDLFDLGKLTEPKEIKGIAAPSRAEAFVQFNFTTENGLPAKFLIRRVTLSPERRKQLRAESKNKAEFKAQIEALTGGKDAIITAFYYQHPNTQTEWTEMYTVTDERGKYSFAPKFDARVYPNGLIILDIKGRKNLIFGAGEKFAQQLLVGKDQIEIGNGKTASAKALYKENI